MKSNRKPWTWALALVAVFTPAIRMAGADEPALKRRLADLERRYALIPAPPRPRDDSSHTGGTLRVGPAEPDPHAPQRQRITQEIFDVQVQLTRIPRLFTSRATFCFDDNGRPFDPSPYPQIMDILRKAIAAAD